MRVGGYYHYFKQTLESHSNHTVLYIQTIIADWTAEKLLKTCVENISRQIFFKLRQQLAIVQISAAMDHMKRDAPFLVSLECSN